MLPSDWLKKQLSIHFYRNEQTPCFGAKFVNTKFTISSKPLEINQINYIF